MTNTVRVRFAPSPTGELHIGNARTALFNYLFAVGRQGALVLRIENTDLDRSADRYAENILNDLKWLGIHWTEGPDLGGPYGPYRQSERLEIYRTALEQLKASDRAYPCFCTPEELERERKEQLARGVPPRYSGRCRRLTDRDRRRLENEGVLPALRFRVDEGSIGLNDRIHGSVSFPGNTIGDFIVVRSTGMPAYNFAVVIDDAHMRITHVIRGEDHLSNTPRQLLLYRFFGFEAPQFAHHALLLGSDRTKLSKRHGGTTTVSGFRERGILPQALANYLVWLGNQFREAEEVLNMEEMAAQLRLESISRKGAVFDPEKLNWFNVQHLRRIHPSDLVELVKPFLVHEGYEPECVPLPLLISAMEAVQSNMNTLGDAAGLLRLLFTPQPHMSREAETVLQDGMALHVLSTLRNALRQSTVTDESEWVSLLKSTAKTSGIRGKAFYFPIRAAVTGDLEGPELHKILPLLGKDRILERLDRILDTGNGSSPL